MQSFVLEHFSGKKFVEIAFTNPQLASLILLKNINKK
jgi:hypothetical protein